MTHLQSPAETDGERVVGKIISTCELVGESFESDVQGSTYYERRVCPVVECWVNGVLGEALLDTGSEISAVSDRFLTELEVNCSFIFDFIFVQELELIFHFSCIHLSPSKKKEKFVRAGGRCDGTTCTVVFFIIFIAVGPWSEPLLI